MGLSNIGCGQMPVPRFGADLKVGATACHGRLGHTGTQARVHVPPFCADPKVGAAILYPKVFVTAQEKNRIP